jgi:hypothetical protein
MTKEIKKKVIASVAYTWKNKKINIIADISITQIKEYISIKDELEREKKTIGKFFVAF